MTWAEIVSQELARAQQELSAAEEGLKAGTEASRTRYARALHEAEMAHARANRVGRDPRWGQAI